MLREFSGWLLQGSDVQVQRQCLQCFEFLGLVGRIFVIDVAAKHSYRRRPQEAERDKAPTSSACDAMRCGGGGAVSNTRSSATRVKAINGE